MSLVHLLYPAILGGPVSSFLCLHLLSESQLFSLSTEPRTWSSGMPKVLFSGSCHPGGLLVPLTPRDWGFSLAVTPHPITRRYAEPRTYSKDFQGGQRLRLPGYLTHMLSVFRSYFPLPISS